MVDCGRLFTLAAIIAWTDHNGRAPIALLREWLVRVRVEARMREMAAVGFDFFSAPYVPEPNPLNPELPLVIAVDPDHILKRWMKHLTTSGFGNFINKAAWEKIASDPRNDAVMGLWWWNRDSQNVADAKDGCSAAVEKLLLEAGCPEEALLCRLCSGLSEEERVARINRLLAWLTPKVCGFFYNEPCSSHLPQIPYHLRQVTPRPQTDYQPDTCLPIELIEATLSLCYGRMAIVQYLESHPQNIIYQQQLSSSPPSAHIPLFNDRWRQSNDVENLFSQLKANLGKALPSETFRTLRNLKFLQSMDMQENGAMGYSRPGRRGHAYEQKEFCKDISRLGEWNTGKTGAQPREADTLARKRVRDDNTAAPCQRTRDYHQIFTDVAGRTRPSTMSSE
ncbi:hypothetical protein DFS34DRAFT_628855 [Phlyctochytrium arcticum]|nr:hypothetical protein DFS34DRAFT_628855 [Phlyctochytrium arcticum]